MHDKPQPLATLWRSLLCQVFLLTGKCSLLPGEDPCPVNNRCVMTDLLEHVYTYMLIRPLR